MPYRWRRSLWAWRSLQRLWQRDTPEGALEAISAALVVTLVILVVTLVALAVSALPASSRPSGATPLTAGTLLLGGASGQPPDVWPGAKVRARRGLPRLLLPDPRNLQPVSRLLRPGSQVLWPGAPGLI
jgi:hypothetical protein